MAAALRLLFFLTPFILRIHFICCVTDQNDGAVLQSLKSYWQNTPPTWSRSSDPCGLPWEGVTCDGSRVTALGLSTMDIKGQLSGDIGGLAELRSLDLSFNKDLIGSIPKGIGNLLKLNTLILAGCGLTGSIPDELGNLTQLTFLALNSNNFTGIIPPSLGKLSELSWFDLAENQLSGPLPVSSGDSPGLDLLLNAKHFHFNKNKLSGPIPENLFSSGMKLIHILFDGNELSGTIPSSIGLVTTLEALRLDRNSLSGEVPSNINNLTRLNELDLSNNSFNASEAPKWFSTLSSLTALVLESGPLHGAFPQGLLSLSQLQQVLLRDNDFNGTLNISQAGSQLQLVDLRENKIESLTPGSGYSNTLMLYGNPYCLESSNTQVAYCQRQETIPTPYTTSLESCGPNRKQCTGFQKLSPASCDCQVPYEGKLTFRAPFFRDVANANLFGKLEESLWSNLTLPARSVFLQNPFFDSSAYLQVQLLLFPSSGKFFSHSDIQRMGNVLSNQLFKPPDVFGPYVFNGFNYPFPARNGVFLSKGAIAGIAVASAFLLLGLVVIALYAIRQQKLARMAIELSRPFASWAPGVKDAGGAPQLKGARLFSFDELKKCTNNFSNSNEIGSGGYGKVYRGVLQDGPPVAIKRAQQGSMQGALEFKTEIELLSRVHHKNLVGLVGFCFEQEEQMLVYEYMPNGTLRESLSGRSGIALDWKMRLRVTLGSARGIAYLHELANPPIIHRDIKTTNILLDENLTAKVADFGLSKLVSDGGKGHVSTQVKGTLGYLDPEYYMTQQLTEKSDVYSFGVVMLELITSKLPIEKGKYIVREVRLAMDNQDDQYCGLGGVMDPYIKKEGSLVGFRKFLDLAMQCVEESANDRPTMNVVVKAIETVLQDDEVNSNPTSASSSATDFGTAKGPPRHPYNDNVSGHKHVAFSDTFDYSSGYNLSMKIEPK
ncbi:hypothetical protein CDL15_Pgr007615 [Punica granatum]|uniref:non-specific serine/threonine protein kinase n=1 Tax=Punica granatum TaxID=22663 RepID=A0A218X9D9_PUNGR|nr:hypothetical protein CDL15_Pgr007615 [Punica granatum]